MVMRFFNTVGPRQTGRYGMVLPRFVRQALAGEPITIYGDGEQSRCFADVADIIDATVKLAQHPGAVGQVFNIGSTEEVTIRELAERVIAATAQPIQDRVCALRGSLCTRVRGHAPQSARFRKDPPADRLRAALFTG